MSITVNHNLNIILMQTKRSEKSSTHYTQPIPGQTKLTKDQVNVLLKRWPQPYWASSVDPKLESDCDLNTAEWNVDLGSFWIEV